MMDKFSLFLISATTSWIWYQLSYLSFLNIFLLFCSTILTFLFGASITGYFFNTAPLHAILWPHMLDCGDKKSTTSTVLNHDDKIAKKIREITGHIIHDYILSWYNTVSHDVTFVQQAFEIFEHIFFKIRIKISQTDARKFTDKVFHILCQHVTAYNNAKELSSKAIRASANFESVYLETFQHPALLSNENETKYLQSIVTELLQKLLPNDYHLTGTSAYIVRELIAHNVLHSIINTASEPAWVYSAIIEVFGPTESNNTMENESKNEIKTVKPEQFLEEKEPLFSNEDEGLLLLADSNTSDESQHCERPPVIGQEDEPVKSDLQRSLTFSNDHFSNLETVDDFEPAISANQYEEITNSNSLLGSTIMNQEDEKIPAGVIFKNIRIPETMSFNESHDVKSKYTLYRITYSSLPNDGQSYEVCRRFREFLTLQERLHNNPVLKKLTENIQGPSRMFPIPFGNMDKAYIEQRRIFLQAYLRQLASVPFVNNCMVLREFLAYKRDPRIAFVQRNDSSIPRIDKLIRNAVSDLFLSSKKENKLGTSTDEEEEEQRDSDNHFLDNPVTKFRNMVLRSTTKLDSEEEWNLKVEVAQFEGTFSSKVCPENWEASCVIQEVREQSSAESVHTTTCGVRTSGDGCDNIETRKDEKFTPLVSANPSVTSLLTIARKIWNLSDGDYCLLSVFASRLLEKYIELNINDLTSHESWDNYLQLFKKHMFDHKKSEKKHENIEVLKKEAVLVLKQTFPSVLNLFLGDKTYISGIEALIESFSNPLFNKKILFHFFILLMKDVFR